MTVSRGLQRDHVQGRAPGICLLRRRRTCRRHPRPGQPRDRRVPGPGVPGAAADRFAWLSIWPVPVRREGDRPDGRLAKGPSRPSDRGGSHVSGDHADDQRRAGQGDAAAGRRLEARAGGPQCRTGTARQDRVRIHRAERTAVGRAEAAAGPGVSLRMGGVPTVSARLNTSCVLLRVRRLVG